MVWVDRSVNMEFKESGLNSRDKLVLLLYASGRVHVNYIQPNIQVICTDACLSTGNTVRMETPREDEGRKSILRLC